ncbi:MAG: flagellar protein FlaG, partial [Syntrophomonas sp.]
EHLKQVKRISEEDLQNAANVMNEAMKISNYHLQFKVHKDSGRVQVKVIDSDTDKVIKEIPPDKVLECSAKIKEMLDHMAGILIDQII